MQEAYYIETEAFSGTLDELREEVLKDNVDIFEVSLTALIDGLYSRLASGEEVPLPVLSRFIMNLVRLIELKNMRLLPGEEKEEVLLDPNEVQAALIARLIEYKKFKSVAGFLGALIETSSAFYPRTAEVERALQIKDFDGRIDPARISLIAERIINIYKYKVEDAKHLIPTPILLERFTEFVNTKLKVQREVIFRDLACELTSKQEVLALFLALLSLYKREQVQLDQDEIFGDILITRTAEDVMDNAAELSRDYE